MYTGEGHQERRQMRRPIYLGMLALLFAIGALEVCEQKKGRFNAEALTVPRPAADFVLKTSDGAEFRLSQYQGKVVLLDFGYTFCPDICPTTLAELAQGRAQLGEAAKRVQVVFITVDPERDSPERLRSYTAVFDPTFIGLTGSAEQLAAVRQAYDVVAEKQVVPGTSAAYLIAHSAYVYLIDPEGRLQQRFSFGTSMIKDITEAIQTLLTFPEKGANRP
jgi:protein SCO1